MAAIERDDGAALKLSNLRRLFSAAAGSHFMVWGIEGWTTRNQILLVAMGEIPGKPPDHVDPIRFQGSPVNAWPRIHSAAVQAIANPKTRPVPDNRKCLLARWVASKAMPA